MDLFRKGYYIVSSKLLLLPSLPALLPWARQGVLALFCLVCLRKVGNIRDGPAKCLPPSITICSLGILPELYIVIDA